MWIAYAKCVCDQRQIYEHMGARDIGTQSSEFWYNYADYFEAISRDFKEASDLYVRGISVIEDDEERKKLLELMKRFSERMD